MRYLVSYSTGIANADCEIGIFRKILTDRALVLSLALAFYFRSDPELHGHPLNGSRVPTSHNSARTS